jgi:HAD superfamily hydrolase (TIGR01509 family)
LRKVGLLDDFAHRIVSAYDVGVWKPDPGLIEHAAQSLSLAVRDCLLVADSAPRIEAGLSAGALVAGYRLDAATRRHFGSRILHIEELGQVRQLL